MAYLEMKSKSAFSRIQVYVPLHSLWWSLYVTQSNNNINKESINKTTISSLLLMSSKIKMYLHVVLELAIIFNL